MPRTDRKEYILQKTFFLLLTKGYDGVSITDIQKETGMSRGLLYHYYGSKEELFREAAERYLVTAFLTQPEETKGFTLPDMMTYIVEKYINISRQWQNYMGMGKVSISDYNFLFYQMMQKEKTIARKYKQLRKDEKNAWTEAAALSFSKGEISDILPAEKIADHFILLLDGIWMQSAEKSSITQYIRITRQALQDYYKLLKA